MKNLRTEDIFIMSRLIMSLNLKEELKNIADKVDKNSDINSVGYEVFFTILDRCTDGSSGKKVYEFLSGPLEIKAEGVETMDPLGLLKKPMEATNVDKWKLSLSKVSQLIKQKLRSFY